MLDQDGLEVLLSRESPTEPPQLFASSFADRTERQLTHFTHPVPELAKVKKQLIKWKRADGLELSGMTPPTTQRRSSPGRFQTTPACVFPLRLV